MLAEPCWIFVAMSIKAHTVGGNQWARGRESSRNEFRGIEPGSSTNEIRVNAQGAHYG